MSVDVAQYFTDPDGDALTYTASSNRTGIVRTSASGSTVTLTPTAAGTATVTVTARDPDGEGATQSIDVTVEEDGGTNRAPRPVGSVPAQTLVVGGRAVSLSVTRFFTDPDGDALTYAARSSRSGVVAVAVSGGTATLTPVAAGTATVTVTGRDPGGLSATQSIAVTVQAGRGDGGFTDDPLVPGVTPVKAVHFRELRTRINALRIGAGLSAYAWTDPVLTQGVTRVRSAHLTELRTALSQAHSAAGQPRPAYTDTVVRADTTPIRAAHVTELRAAVIRFENAAPTGLAPADQAAFEALVAGKQIVHDARNRLIFTGPGRIREIDDGTPYAGNYRYVRTGPNTGTLTYTYDATGNNLDEEKSEVRLTFTSATAGTFVYTYSERGSPAVVRRGRFELVDADGSGRAPDLVVGSPTVTDGTLDPRQSFTLSVTVRNEGAARADATTLRYYRSTDSTISTSDTAVGSDRVSALEAGASGPESIALTAPISAGSYYYGACVEPVREESDTGNNCSAGVLVTVESDDRTDRIESRITECSGRRFGLGTLEVRIKGTVRALVDVFEVRVRGWVGAHSMAVPDFLGSISAGESKNFSLLEFVDEGVIRAGDTCSIIVEFKYRTSGGGAMTEAAAVPETEPLR